MDVELCPPCGTRYQAHDAAARSIGEDLSLPVITYLLCPDCFLAVTDEAAEEPDDSRPPDPSEPVFPLATGQYL